MARKSAKPNMLSLSAFVRETLGKKKDAQDILDYFSGNKTKVDDFLDRMETATATPHLLSRARKGSASSLHSESDWKVLLDSIRLKFPNLSNKNRHSLKVISQRLEQLKEHEVDLGDTQDLVWSQASRQPSDSLTSEDMKWLYDLNDDQLENEASLVLLDSNANSNKQFFFTLSQVLDEPRDELSTKVIDPEVISDSESEPEPLELLNYTQKSQMLDILSHQKITAPDSIDVLTSILFPPTYKNGFTQENTVEASYRRDAATHSKRNADPDVIFSSPVKPKPKEHFQTPTKWPSHLVITSSPPSSGRDDVHVPEEVKTSQDVEEIYSTARTDLHEKVGADSQLLDLQVQSSLPQPKANRKRMTYSTSTIEFEGPVDITSQGQVVKIRKLYSKPVGLDDVVPDSEDDDAEISIIEITKPIEDTESNKSILVSVLQVPSSPTTNAGAEGTSKILLKMLHGEIRSHYSMLGLGPTKSRNNMISAIEYALQLTNLSLDTPFDFPLLGRNFQICLFDEITRQLRLSEELHCKIASFEPIPAEIILHYLKKQYFCPVDLDISLVQRYCDQNGVLTIP